MDTKTPFRMVSTRASRAAYAMHHIMPVKVRVRQPDGSYFIQICDADVRRRSKKVRKDRKAPRIEEQE